MKQSIVESVKQYAKDNKCNGAKLLLFVESLLQENSPQVGRKAKQETLILRQNVSQWLDDNKGQIIQSKDIAQQFACSMPEANNVLKVYSGRLQCQGKAAHNGRGRKPTLWKII